MHIQQHYQRFPIELVSEKPSPPSRESSQMTTGSLADFLDLLKDEEDQVLMSSSTSSSSSTRSSDVWLAEDTSSDESSASGSDSNEAQPEDDFAYAPSECTASKTNNNSETQPEDNFAFACSPSEMQLIVNELRKDTFEPLIKDLFAMDWEEEDAATATTSASLEPLPLVIKSSVPKPDIVKGQPPCKKKQPQKPKATKAQSTVNKSTKRVRKDYDAPFGKRFYFTLTDQDVGLGRGGEMNRHKGNLRFHASKRNLQPLYKTADKDVRTKIAQALVDEVHNWGGRFLKKDKLGWYEIHNHTARTKCSQALREDYTDEERAAKREKHRQLRKQRQN